MLYYFLWCLRARITVKDFKYKYSEGICYFEFYSRSTKSCTRVGFFKDCDVWSAAYCSQIKSFHFSKKGCFFIDPALMDCWVPPAPKALQYLRRGLCFSYIKKHKCLEQILQLRFRCLQHMNEPTKVPGASLSQDHGISIAKHLMERWE